jgi:uncharacterized membrane protein
MEIDLFSLLGPTMVFAFAVPLLTTGLVIAVVIWAIRRTVPPQDNPAVAELKSRLARGEIDPTEYQVRLRALERDD